MITLQNNTEEDVKIDEETNYLVVVVYDVTHNRRRYRLSKKLLAYGNRVQRSVFECILTTKKYRKLLKEIPKYIDANEDYLRIYKLPLKSEIEIWGNIGFTEKEDFFFI